MGIGDIISQAAFEGRGIKDIDKGRAIRFAGIGLFFTVSKKNCVIHTVLNSMVRCDFVCYFDL
jgi:hypothetical protein